MMKKIATILLFGLVLIFMPRPVYAADPCLASTPDTFKDCINAVQNGTANDINITGRIVCDSAAECGNFRFSLSNLDRPVSIYGSSPDSGFTRNNEFGYILLFFSNTGNVTLSNLTFEDNAAQNCSANPLDEACGTIIQFNNGGSALINNITISHAKRYGILLYFSTRAPDITISNSSFSDIGAHAVFVGNGYEGGTIKILNNKFIRTANNAVDLSITSPQSSPSIIQGNEFINNHKKSLYNVCTKTDQNPEGRCPGGQLFIYPTQAFQTTNVIARGNLFRDGHLDVPIPGDIYGVACIETTGVMLSNILLTDNFCINNDEGLVAGWPDPSRPLSTGMKFTNNHFAQIANQAIAIVPNYPPNLLVQENNRTDETPDQILELYRQYKARTAGDLNGDEHVDINDFNMFNGHFPRAYTIFDYNTLVANFGK